MCYQAHKKEASLATHTKGTGHSSTAGCLKSLSYVCIAVEASGFPVSCLQLDALFYFLHSHRYAIGYYHSHLSEFNTSYYVDYLTFLFCKLSRYGMFFAICSVFQGLFHLTYNNNLIRIAGQLRFLRQRYHPAG